MGRVDEPWHLSLAEAVEELELVNAYRADAGNFLAGIVASGSTLLPYINNQYLHSDLNLDWNLNIV